MSLLRGLLPALVVLAAGCWKATGVQIDAAVDGAVISAPTDGPPPADAPPLSYPGLVGYWRFDEGRGATASDSSPTANAGGLQGGALFSANGFTRARFPNPGSLALDGVDGRVVLPTRNLPATGAPKTISLWMSALGAATGNRDLIALTSSAAQCGVIIGLRGTRLAVTGWGGGELISTPAPRSGWHHVLYTFDGTSHTLVVDGVVAQPTAVPPQACAVTEAVVGNLAGGNEPFQGNLDDLRIYDRVLGAGEVGVLASGDEPAIHPPADGAPTTPVDAAIPDAAPEVTDAAIGGPFVAGLVGYWAFDEGMGTTTADLSGSGNDGVMTGVPAFVAGGFPAAKFKNPFALMLNGKPDLVTVGINRLPTIDQPKSVSLWFNYPVMPATGNRTMFSLTSKAETCGIQLGTRAANLTVSLWGGTVLVSTPAPAPGWHHMVYTWDGTTHSLYLDGAAPVTGLTPPQICTATAAIIGDYDGGNEYFVGQLDDVRVWADRVLTPAEVASLFAGDQ